jgi:transcriptional regulator with XRE-family HTH domain
VETNTDQINNVQYGAQIKVLRLKHWLTHKDCAKQLEISTKAFINIESGIVDVSMSRLQQIADFFEVSLGTMLATKPIVDETDAALFKELQDKLTDMDREVISLQRRLIMLYDLIRQKNKRQSDDLDSNA